jgi:hypothetical protein
MFKKGDIVRDIRFKKNKYIVVGTSDKDQQLSMLDYDDSNFMFLGNYCYLEIDIVLTRKLKIEKLKKNYSKVF